MPESATYVLGGECQESCRAGGAFSTLMTSARDLVTFARALLNGGVGFNGVRILSAVSALRMTKPTATFVNPNQQVGLGWMIVPGGVLTHFGGGPGVSSRLFAHPASGQVAVLLTNCDRGERLAQQILIPIVESWTGIKNSISQSNDVPVNPKPYEGVYESNLYRIEVIAREGRLAMRLTMKMPLYDNSPYGGLARERPALTLHPLGDHAFEAEPLLPGASKVALKFARSDTQGRMHFLAMAARLLARTH